MTNPTQKSATARLLVRRGPHISDEQWTALRAALELAIQSQQTRAADCPLVVQTTGLIETTDGLAVEELTGGTTSLESLLHAAPLEERYAAAIGVQICDALLAVCYRSETMPEPHGALRAGAIFEHDGHVQVADFGIAGALEGVLGPGAAREELELLAPYVARELWLNPQSHGELRDLFAVGVLLYELATGTHPYGVNRTDYSHCEQRLLAGTPKPAAAANAELAASFADVLDRAVARREEERFATVQALRDALLPIAGAAAVAGAALPAELLTLPDNAADVGELRDYAANLVRVVADQSGWAASESIETSVAQGLTANNTQLTIHLSRSPIALDADARLDVRQVGDRWQLADAQQARDAVLDALSPAVLNRQRTALNELIATLDHGLFTRVALQTELDNPSGATLARIEFQTTGGLSTEAEIPLLWNAAAATWQEREQNALQVAALEAASELLETNLRRELADGPPALVERAANLRFLLSPREHDVRRKELPFAATLMLDAPDGGPSQTVLEFDCAFPPPESGARPRWLRQAEKHFKTDVAAESPGSSRRTLIAVAVITVLGIVAAIVAFMALNANNTPTKPGVSVGLPSNKHELVRGSTDAYPYSLALPMRPNAVVKIKAQPDSQLSVGAEPGVPLVLEIAPDDWNVPQMVQVRAALRKRDDESETGRVTHTVSSLDERFNGLEIPDVVIKLREPPPQPSNNGTQPGSPEDEAARQRRAEAQQRFDDAWQRLSDAARNPQSTLADLRGDVERFQRNTPSNDDLTDEQRAHLQQFDQWFAALEAYARTIDQQSATTIPPIIAAVDALLTLDAQHLGETGTTASRPTTDLSHLRTLLERTTNATDTWVSGYLLRAALRVSASVAQQSALAAPLHDALLNVRNAAAQTRIDVVRPALDAAAQWLQTAGSPPTGWQEHFARSADAGTARTQLDAIGLYLPKHVVAGLARQSSSDNAPSCEPLPQTDVTRSDPAYAPEQTLDGLVEWNDLPPADQQTLCTLLHWTTLTIPLPANAATPPPLTFSYITPPAGQPAFWLARTETTQGHYYALLPDAQPTDDVIADQPITNVSVAQAQLFQTALAEYTRQDVFLPEPQQWAAGFWTNASQLADADPDLRRIDESGTVTIALDRANLLSMEQDENLAKRTGRNDGFGGASPAAAYAPNRWQLYDMLGNVAEYVYVANDTETSQPTLGGDFDAWASERDIPTLTPDKPVYGKAVNPATGSKSVGFRVLLPVPRQPD